MSNRQAINRLNLKGKKFGKITVIQELESDKRFSKWKCICDCGKEKDIIGCLLTRKKGVKSCGCATIQRNKETHIKHGKRTSKVYNIWQGMKARCLRKTASQYKYYGGKGIQVCDEWLKFENFYKDMGDPPEGKSLDRIDSGKGYFKENCKWSTIKEQNSNRKTVIKIFYNGSEQTLYDLWSQFAKPLGLHYSTMKDRLDKGLSIDQCLKLPSQRGKRFNPIFCKICGLKHKAKGYCQRHYRNLLDFGNPLSKKEQESK